MAHQAERAGVIGGGRRARGTTAFRRACVETLESRILMSHSAIIDTRPAEAVGHVGWLRPSIPLITTAPAGFAPADVRKAYGFDQTLFGTVAGDGTGSTIAIVDAYNDPTIQADVAAFDAAFGLAAANLTVINQGGGTSLPPLDPNGRGNSWAQETSLDVEWAHAMAPGANIVLVQTNSPIASDLFAGVTTAKNYAGVSVVSMSFGLGEAASDLANNALFSTPTGHTGVTFIASAGDFGAFNGGGYTKAVSFPASSPNVVAVGGTSLTVNSDGTYGSESAWGNAALSGSYGGGGGGISRFQPQPGYQKGVVTQSTSKRTLPDVSFLADPNTGVAVYDSYDSPADPWGVIGGTSLAAPMWAGLMAIVNQGRTLAGKATMDGGTQTLPAIYALPQSDFNDITTGNNGFAATTGYDLATGRGTPIVNLVVRDLAGSSQAVVLPSPVIGSFTVAPTSVTAGDFATLTATDVSESSGTVGSVIFYRETNGTAGLQPATDTLVGVGYQQGTTYTMTTSTAGLPSGNYTYYAVATDVAGQSTTATTSLTVASGVATNDSFASGTLLSTTVAAVSGTNVGATKEGGEPTIAKTPGGKSVWFTWTAPATGTVYVNTSGSTFDTLLGVYTGVVVSKLKQVAANDDISYAVATSALSFKAKAGTTYHIAVDGYSGASGTYNLNLTEAPAPAKKKK